MVRPAKYPLNLILSVFYFLVLPNSFVWSDEAIKILERADVQKKLKVTEFFVKNNHNLRNYSTISFYINNELIFCHISNNKSEPRVICH